MKLPLGRELEFLQVVWAVDQRLEQASRRLDRALGITGPQRLVLRLTGRFPGITAGALADVLRVHPSTVTGLLRRLERRGLVARRRDPRDARRSFLGLTQKGQLLNQRAHGSIEDVVERLLERQGDAKVSHTVEVLSAFAAALDATAHRAVGPRHPGPR
jgi:MarR family transcriptional regulator, organic hydroperoxide resistance regulator